METAYELRWITASGVKDTLSETELGRARIFCSSLAWQSKKGTQRPQELTSSLSPRLYSVDSSILVDRRKWQTADPVYKTNIPYFSLSKKGKHGRKVVLLQKCYLECSDFKNRDWFWTSFFVRKTGTERNHQPENHKLSTRHHGFAPLGYGITHIVILGISSRGFRV